MIKSILFLLLLPTHFCLALGPTNQDSYWVMRNLAKNYPIIPQPQQVIPSAETFFITPETRILLAPYTKESHELASYLVRFLSPRLGAELLISSMDQTQAEGCIMIEIDADKIRQEEGYQISITQKSIEIIARTTIGAFWALQTVRQLMPANIERRMHLSSAYVPVPGAIIIDAPRFAYRGLHLDVSRHMFSTDDIKKYIDLLAFYKLNKFHWHLTDDQGWRIEIKKYPLLQEISAYRQETVIGHMENVPRKYDGKRYGGYYSQEEVKEIVEYASQRHVTVIPEIELPGHCLAALAAYPELGCTGGPYWVADGWGIMRDVFCAGNEKTFAFLEDVLSEVIDLFPSKLIHIGGDEVIKGRWKACMKCQTRMQEEGLKNENELQSYFVARIEKFVNAKGRQIVGWDEIVEGGLAPNAVVMSWRGIGGGIEAAACGHYVIMTPQGRLYFDHYQSESPQEPLAIYGLTPLKKVYDYEPMPTQLTPEQEKFILGIQANVWTEYIESMQHVEYMAYPRALALAEVAWSQGNNKDYDNFLVRVDNHKERLQAQGVYCAAYER